MEKKININPAEIYEKFFFTKEYIALLNNRIILITINN